MTLPPRTPARSLRRLAAHVAGAVSLATAAALVPTAAEAAPWPGHPDRSIVRYAVKPGDTATGLAVRFHAWTAELIRLNRLGSRGTLYQGQVLRIPVVVSATRRDRGRAAVRPASHPRKHQARKHAHKHRAHKHRAHHRAHRRAQHSRPLLRHSVPPRSRGWLHADLSRQQVRRLVSRMAVHYNVPRTLALAIAWQESGWQQRRVSSAGALGVMQVMPDTGRWMRWYAGRPLRLRDTHDNIQAGMLTLRTLRGWTRRDTKRYVRSVRAHQRNIIRTGSPI